MASGERPSPEEIVLYDKDPETKIATITFNRPDHLNAPTSAARLRYADLLRGATVDDDVKVVIIRGVGEDLGSGADLPDFMAGTDEDRLAELRVDDPNVTYPPQGSFRHGATMGQWYANAAAGNRALQELKKITSSRPRGIATAGTSISAPTPTSSSPAMTHFSAIPRSATSAGDRGCGPGC
jgi:enoyl-CoA hydratase/carnithine racemase